VGKGANAPCPRSHHDYLSPRGLRFAQRHPIKKKGSGTPANALSYARTQAACGTRHGERRLAPPSACGRARLPAFHCGSHQRDFRPGGSASGQASREATRRSGHSRKRRLFGHSDAPRAPVVMPAGMMPEPPGCGVYRSARGRRTRSACREYPPRRRPLKSEIGCGYCHSSGEVKRRRILFDESEPIKARVLPEGRGTPMIRWCPVSSLPDLIRQSMRNRRVAMDHPVKFHPGDMTDGCSTRAARVRIGNSARGHRTSPSLLRPAVRKAMYPNLT
jgi:hypothetical protein